jgi:hypothetical protein
MGILDGRRADFFILFFFFPPHLRCPTDRFCINPYNFADDTLRVRVAQPAVRLRPIRRLRFSAESRSGLLLLLNARTCNDITVVAGKREGR